MINLELAMLMFLNTEDKESVNVDSDSNDIIGLIYELLFCIPIWVLILLFIKWIF